MGRKKCNVFFPRVLVHSHLNGKPLCNGIISSTLEQEIYMVMLKNILSAGKSQKHAQTSMCQMFWYYATYYNHRRWPEG